MLLSVPGGKWVDRIGLRLPMTAGAALMGLGVVMPVFFWSLTGLLLASVSAGLGYMSFHLGSQKAIGLLSNEHTRTAHFSLFALGFSVSGFVGPTLAGFAIDLAGHRESFGWISLSALIALAGLWRFAFPASTAPSAVPGVRARLRDLVETPEQKRLFLAVVILSSAWDVHQFLVPIYGAGIGLSASQIGLVLGAFSVATFMIRIAAPWLVSRIGEWYSVLVAMGFAAVVYLAIPLFPAFPMLLLLSFVLGLGLGMSQPMTLVLLHRLLPPARIGEAVGLRMSLIYATQSTLPVGFGALGASVGLVPVFWSMSVAIVAGAGFIGRGLARAGLLERRAADTKIRADDEADGR